ncbi:MAG: ribbon-helix-helix domain-containing protein [Sphingomonas sp.]
MTGRITTSADGFGGPVKRSLTIAGHPTSLSLEPAFWDALEHTARALNLPISAIVAEIDAQRIMTPAPSNLASAMRVWLFTQRLNATDSQ